MSPNPKVAVCEKEVRFCAPLIVPAEPVTVVSFGAACVGETIEIFFLSCRPGFIGSPAAEGSATGAEADTGCLARLSESAAGSGFVISSVNSPV
jgi:hypothetical protein